MILSAVLLFLYNPAVQPPALSISSASPRPRVQEAPGSHPFFFFQIADVQFGMFQNDAAFEQESANFEFVIASANRLHPAFVVSCGDLVNKAGDARQIAEYRRIAARLDRRIPLYNVPGNHDVGNEPTADSLAAYRENFGPDYYRFDCGTLRGLVLNSSLIASPGRAMGEYEKQEKWLREELLRLTSENARPILVFQHHPWFLQEPGEKDQYFNIPLARRRTYLELFKNHDVTHVFAGHYHRNAIASTDGLQMVTTGPVGKSLGKDPSGFRIVKIRGSSVEHEYYGLGSIPDRVAFEAVR